MPNVIDPILGLQQNTNTEEMDRRTYDPILGSSYSLYPTITKQDELGSKYDESVQPFMNLQKVRSDRQSGLSQLGSAINQAVVGEIIGGTIEGLGYLLDVEQYGNLAAGTEQEFGNWFSNIGKGMRTWAEEETPIYIDPDQSKFAPGHWSWWMSNAPSVASTLSLVIPSGAVTRGLSALGKATGIANEMGLAARWATKGITQAVVSRHMENMMEASGTFNELKNEALANGMSDEEATKKAAIGASESYKMNWVMLAQDIPQYLLLNRAFSKASLDNTIATARAMGKSIAPIVGKKSAAIGWDMLGEGAEEAYQYIVGEEAKYQAQKAYDPSVKSSFSDRLSEYTSNGDFWTSAFFGALGAGVTQTVGKAINNVMQGKKDPRIEDIQSWGQQFSYWNQRLREAQEDGDVLSERFIKDNLWGSIGTKAASVGNIRNAMDFLEAMQNPTKEELEQFGVNEDDLKVFKTEIPRGVQKLKRIEELYNLNSRKYEPGRAAYVTQLQNQLENAVTHRNQLNNKVTEKRNELLYLNDLYKTPFVAQYITDKTELINLKKNIKMFDTLLNKENIPEREKEAYTDALSRSKSELEVLTNKLKDTRALFDSKIEPGDTPEIKETKKAKQEILKQIDDIAVPALDEYMSIKQQLDLFDNHIKSLQSTLADAEKGKPISTPEEREQYEQDKAEEEKETKQYTPTNDDLVEYNDGVFKVLSDNEDNTFLLEQLDESGRPIEGVEPIIVNKDSATLYAKKGGLDTQDSIETVNDSDIPEIVQKPYHELKKGLRSISDAITHSGFDINPVSGKYETNVRDKVFDEYLSNPDNTLENDIISLSIDTSTSDEYKTNFWNKHKDLKQKIDSGKALSKEEINTIINNITKVSGVDNFNSLVDKLPIKVSYKREDGAIHDKGLYYHDSDYADARHLNIPNKVRREGTKAVSDYIKQEREKTRDIRRKIIYALLSGKEITMTNIKKTKGIPNNVKGNFNIAEVLKQDPNSIQLGVVDSTSKAWIDTDNYMEEGIGHPGSVFFSTNKTPNKQSAAIKANISKLSREHAEILWDAILIKNKKGSGGNQAIFPDDRVKGLTVGQTIDLLTLYGPMTNISHPGNENKSYLENKQLYVEKGFFHFGTTTINPQTFQKILNGSIDNSQFKQQFIDWATKNKNYSVPKGSIRKPIYLNKPFGKDVKIGSWEINAKDTLAGALIRGGMVTTDVNEYENTGSLFHAPVTIIDTTSLKAVPKPKAKQQTQTITKQVETVQKQTPKVEVGNKVILREGKHKSTRSTIAELPNNTDIYTTSSITEVDTNITQIDTKLVVSIKDGKYVTAHPLLKSMFGLQINKKLESVDINSKTTEILTMFINDQSDVYADTKDSSQGLNKQVEENVQTITPTETKAESEQINSKDYDPNFTIDDVSFGSPEVFNLIANELNKYPKWDQEKELSWLTDKLGDVPVEIIDGLIELAKTNKKAFGQLRRDSILLSNVALKGTTYHEAFHRVSMLYLDNDSRQKIYNEARTKYNLSNYSDIEVEEYLAEKFREYSISRETEQPLSIFGRIGKFFKELYLMIKSVFTGNNQLTDIDIDKLFSSIHEGKYKYNKPLADNLKKWIDNPNLTYKDVALDQIDTYKAFKGVVKGLSAELLKGVQNKLFSIPTTKYSTISVIDSVEQIDFEKLRNDIKTGLVGTFTKLARNRSYEYDLIQKGQISPELTSTLKSRYGVNSMDQIKEMVQQEVSKYTNWKNLYEEVITNFDNIYKPAITDYIYNELSIKRIDIDQADEDATNKELLRFDKAAYEYSAKENIQGAIKFLLSNLRNSTERNSETGLVDIAPLNEVWTRLLNITHKAQTVEEMIQVLDANSHYLPFADLSKHLKTHTELLRTQFESTLRLHKHDFINCVVEVSEVDEKVNYNFRFIDADVHSAGRMIRKEWGQNFTKSDLFANGKEFNKQLFKKIQKNFKDLLQDYRGDINTLSDQEFEEYKDKLINIINQLGIDIDSRTVDNIILDKMFDKKASSKEKALESLMGTDLFHLFSDNSSILKYDPKGELNTPVKALNDESIVRELAESFVRTNPQDLPDTVLGAEGNKHYKYSQPTYITDILSRLKTDPDFLQQMKSDVLANKSLVLNRLEDKEILENIGVGTFNALIIDNTGDDGRDYLSISPVEDFLYKLNISRNGYMILPTLADRKTYYVIKGINLAPKGEDSNIRYQVDKDGNASLPKWVIDTFVDYANAERDRIEKVQTDIELAKELGKINLKLGHTAKLDYYRVGDKRYPVDITNLVENLHYTKDGDNVKFDNANGSRHIIFTELEGKHPTEFRSIIEETLKDRIRDTFNEAKRLGILSNTENYLLDNTMVNSLTNEFGGNKSLALASIIADFEIKTQISSIETMMLFMGDIAYYKGQDPMDDYVKRLSVVTSSGALLRRNIPEEFEGEQYTTTTLFDQKLQSVWYDTIYKKQKELLLKKYNNDEKYVDKLLRNILDAYKQVNSTDAQVFISPEMHREISIRRGEWSDKEQKAFDLLQSDKELTPEEEQEALNAVMQPLKYVYFDRIKQDINNTTSYLIPTYDKMSLATLFRRFTKDTHLDELLDRMESKGKYEGYNKIHMVKFESAVKAGNRRRIKLLSNTEGGRFDPEKQVQVSDLSTMSTYKQNFRYLRHQVVTDPHDVEEGLFATQVRKVAQANVDESADYIINGNPIKGKEVRNAINKSLSILSDKGITKLLNKLGSDSEGNIDNELFYNTLLDEAKKAGMPINVIEALEKKIPIDLLPDRKWIYQRLISLVNKHGIDLKLPGNQLVQQSGYGLGNNKGKDKTNNLRFLFDENDKIKGVECAVSVQLFRNVIPNYKNKSYKQKVQWLKDNNQILEGLGYRIPTQGQNSTVPLTIVEFLPENVGDVIILPNEFTALTGSDFDIDKLFFVRYNYRLDKNGIAKKIELSTGTDIDSIYNRYNDLVREIFEDAPVLDKESEIRLHKLYKLKFNKRQEYADLFGEQGATFSILNSRYNALSDMLDKAMNIEDSFSFNTILKEMRNIKTQISDMDFYKEDISDLDSQIRDELRNIADILIKNGLLPTIDIFKDWDIIRQNTRKAVQNHLLDNYRGILLSDNNFTYASSPLGSITGMLQKLADELVPSNKKKAMLSGTGVVNQAKIKQKYSGGKGGVGPEALNNVHHVLCQIAKVSFNKNIGLGIVDENGNTSLHSIDSLPEDNGQIIAISDWLSALIDSHVDIAKDPYIINLNVNSHTYNIVNLLIRIGLGSKTFHFTAQPILKELVEQLNYEVGEVRTETLDKPEELIRQKYMKGVEDFQLSATYDPFKDKGLKKLVTSEEKTPEWYAKQVAILDKFIQLDSGKFWGTDKSGKDRYLSNPLDQGAAKDLSTLVMGSRVDTKKYATDLISNELYIQGLNDIIKDNKFTNLDKLLGYDPETELADWQEYGTFLGPYLNNSSLMLRQLFGDKSITGTKSFQNAVFRVAKQAGINKYTPNRVVKIGKIADEVYSALMSRFFIEEMGLDEGGVSKLLSFVPEFLTNVYVKHPELKKNVLIQQLVKGLETIDELTFTGIPSIKNDESLTREDLMFGWKELLESDNKDVVSFAKRLYPYSYYTSGFKQGLFSIHSNIPVDLFEHFQINDLDASFTKYTTELLDLMKDEEKGNSLTIGIEEEIFKNNWYNSSLVPRIFSKGVKNNIFVGKGDSKQTVAGDIFTMKKDEETGTFKANVNKLGYNEEGQPIYQPYILYQVDKENSLLMEYIGYHNNKYETPVYKVIEKRGFSSKGRKIVEYGLDTSVLQRNTSIKTLSDDKLLKLMKKQVAYNNFVYIPTQSRIVSETSTTDSPQEDIVEKTYTTTEDRLLNVGVENGLKSSFNMKGINRVQTSAKNIYKNGVIQIDNISKELYEILIQGQPEGELSSLKESFLEKALSLKTKSFDVIDILQLENTEEFKNLQDYLSNKQKDSISQEQLDAINNKHSQMSPFNTIGVAYKKDYYTPFTMDDWNNLSEDEQNNLLNCL